MGNEFEDEFLKDGSIKMDGAIVKWALKFAFDMERIHILATYTLKVQTYQADNGRSWQWREI